MRHKFLLTEEDGLNRYTEVIAKIKPIEVPLFGPLCR